MGAVETAEALDESRHSQGRQQQSERVRFHPSSCEGKLGVLSTVSKIDAPKRSSGVKYSVSVSPVVIQKNESFASGRCSKRPKHT